MVKGRICAHRAWVQIPLVPIWVIGGSRKGVRPRLLPFTSKSPTLEGKSACNIEQGQGSQRH